VPRERVRRQPRAQTREELLAAAARVFSRRGFHGASVDAVSEEAGFSTGAVYSNFGSKEELFLTLYEQRIARRRRELRAAVEGAGGSRAGLASASAEVEEVFHRDRDWFLLYFEFALHAARNPDFARRFEAVREEGLAELAEGLAHGLEGAGIAPPLPVDELARAVRALTYGLALDRLVEDDPSSNSALGQILELISRGMRAEAEVR
jgi:AcrR family transcriptional regulator